MSTSNLISAPAPTPAARELDLFAFILLMLRNLRIILGCGAIAFVLMVVQMVRAKPRFASTAVMIVPQGNVTAANLASQLSLSTVDLLGGGFELYGDILRSRVVADALIQNHDLEKDYGLTDQVLVEERLASLTTIKTQREGLISVTVEDTDPQRAADIANDYLRQLELLNKKLVLTNASEQREYLEREMYAEKDRLADAEVALRQVQENTNGLPPETQASASVLALENARANLRADQIRLAALLTGETEENPDVVRVRSEIGGLEAQVESLQHGQASSTNGTPTSAVPQEELDFVRRKRDVTFHETLFELLEKQYETAKQQEAKSPSIVQVLDPAIPSRHKAWPPRLYYCLLAAIAGLIAGVFLVGVKAVALAYVKNPQNAERLKQLKTFWKK